MAFYSPLRYPGGKGKMLEETLQIINKNNLIGCTYIEPFAGGANLALNLLFSGNVERIILNDIDLAIYAVWYSIMNHNSEFIEFIERVPLNLNEYNNQRIKYYGSHKSLLELGLATFYLNRTNRSGIITAGPIGGYNQSGKYLLDCRFNRKELSTRIKRIYNNKELIEIFNEDARVFLRRSFPQNSFLFVDPPYYNKGAELYRNFFTHDDHLEIAGLVRDLVYPWIVTYDNVEPIIKMYNFSRYKKYNIPYSVQTKRMGNEIMFSSAMLKI